MPDPAVERARQIHSQWAADPWNPTIAPRERRVIDVDALPRNGFFSRLAGKPKYQFQRPLPQPGGGGGAVPPPPAAIPGMDIDWVAASAAASAAAGGRSGGVDLSNIPGMNMQLLSNPANMSWRERRMVDKAQRDQQKAAERMMRVQNGMAAVQMEEFRRWEKAEEKRQRKEAKQKLKELRWEQRHPFRPLPNPSPANPNAPAAPVAPAAPASHPMTFMMLPTMEEFGVRRPLDSVAQPGSERWPMMSRTMTFALQDMNRDERIHMIMTGQLWNRTTGW